MSKMTRVQTLSKALEYVTHDRNIENGDPEDNFRRIAKLWQVWFEEKYGITFTITETDVAMLSMLIKVARLLVTEDKEDNWVDIAGYAACGSECASIEAAKKEALALEGRQLAFMSDVHLGSADFLNPARQEWNINGNA